MSIYHYRIGKNKVLSYNTIGIFRCPEAIKELKEDEKNNDSKGRFTIEGYSATHSEMATQGDTRREVIRSEDKETPEGRVHITEALYRKVKKGNEPFCKCGKRFVWQGYPVWYKYVYPNAKIVAGLFRDGRRDKTYWTKYFKTRKARDKFIIRFLAKHQILCKL